MMPNLRPNAEDERRSAHAHAGAARFVVVTGLSGAGKSQTMKCFEDLGFFCVDNLPSSLIAKFVDLIDQAGGRMQRVALMIDARADGVFGDAAAALSALDAAEVPYHMLFLESSDQALVRRFSETRRKHPLDRGGRLLDAIAAERTHLAPFKERADYVWDTSVMTLSQLKERVVQTFGAPSDAPQMHTSVVAFGFKNGIPLDADLIFDVRFLPNPNYVPELKDLTGANPAVEQYLESTPLTTSYLKELFRFVDFLIPHFVEEGKSHLTIAVGCTGGRHRSVFVARRLAAHLHERHSGIDVTLHSRDTQL
ncbi:RNase adapter RapZ [bacterium]|nr:MAG: RNase adapter RapZ [bacterium]